MLLSALQPYISAALKEARCESVTPKTRLFCENAITGFSKRDRSSKLSATAVWGTLSQLPAREVDTETALIEAFPNSATSPF